jgi:NAD(P)-dependent dehydrogenase (short-subunit alcohol dehydrogenase family)
MSRLTGKTALVTGAAKGIGEAIARAFVDNGAFVYLTDIDDENGHSVILDLGRNASYRHLDVREESDWKRVVNDILEERGETGYCCQ